MLGLSRLSALIVFALVVQGCSSTPKKAVEVPLAVKEKHFKSLKQLTFEGTNAEAYFSRDGKKLIFQGHISAQGCDQIYMMNVDGTGKELVSIKGGRNTCSYFLGDDKILFSSTFEESQECPKEHDRSKGYVWDIFKSYDIYTANLDGSNVKPLTRTPGYDAEATVCGKKIVFTSARKGNTLSIYTMNLDGSGLKKLTPEVGYNGGPFFSADCSKIVYRAYHPKGKANIKRFKKAIAEGYVPPSPLEIYVMNADGSGKKQLTQDEAASFAPSFYPKGNKVIFSSNRGASSGQQHHGAPGRVFQLWGISASGKGAPEQITTEGTFNGFPMFSPDGKYLVFASNRNSSNPHHLQVFIAEWID